MKVLSSVVKAVFLIAFTVNINAQEWEGKSFPPFELANQHGETISNSKFSGEWVVYYFYPKDDTPGCSIEAENFAKNHEALKAMGLNIVGISLDGVKSHKSFADKFGVKFDLLADVDKKLSEQLDLVNTFPWPHTRRETFIVNPDGVIVKHYPEVSPKKHVAQIMEDFKKLPSKSEG